MSVEKGLPRHTTVSCPTCLRSMYTIVGGGLLSAIPVTIVDVDDERPAAIPRRPVPIWIGQQGRALQLTFCSRSCAARWIMQATDKELRLN